MNRFTLLQNDAIETFLQISLQCSKSY